MKRLAARADVYLLLSRAYHSPEHSFLKGDFSRSLTAALGTLAMDPCAGEVKGIESYLQACQKPMELAVEYTRLFRGPVKAEVYPYESIYVEGEVMGSSTLDVVKRYGEAGVGLAAEFKDLPDHISAELEFMHYLCGRELDALARGADDEAAGFRLLGQGFLKDHLGRWVPEFTGLVMRHATIPCYVAIASITREFIRRECAGDPLGRTAPSSSAAPCAKG